MGNGWSAESRAAQADRMKKRASTPEFQEKVRAGVERAKAARKMGRPKGARVTRDESVCDAIIRFGYLHGITAREIGAFLGISKNAVLGRAYRVGLSKDRMRDDVDKSPSTEAIAVAKAWEERLERMFG